MVVFKGSRCRAEMVPSLMALSGKQRQRLIDTEELKLEDGSYVFQSDRLFRSPSGACDMVLGRGSNGWIEWKDAGGRTLDELKRRKLAVAD